MVEKKQTSQESESRRPPPLSARRSNGSTTRARTPPRARIARAFERAPERRLALAPARHAPPPPPPPPSAPSSSSAHSYAHPSRPRGRDSASAPFASTTGVHLRNVVFVFSVCPSRVSPSTHLSSPDRRRQSSRRAVARRVASRTSSPTP